MYETFTDRSILGQVITYFLVLVSALVIDKPGAVGLYRVSALRVYAEPKKKNF